MQGVFNDFGIDFDFKIFKKWNLSTSNSVWQPLLVVVELLSHIFLEDLSKIIFEKKLGKYWNVYF